MTAHAPPVKGRLLLFLLMALLPADAFARLSFLRTPVPALQIPSVFPVVFVVSVAAGMVIVVAGALLVFNRRLQRRVLDRTADLARTNRALKSEITERTRAERRKAESEIRYQALVEGTGAIPFRIEVTTHRYLYLGPQAAAMLGRPAAHWKGSQDWFELIHPDDRPRVERERRRKMALREPFDLEYRYLHADGSVRWLHEIVSFLTGREEPDEAVGFILDFTAVKESDARRAHLDESLREARKLESLGVLAGGIAHDLNNLLMPILGHLELLDMDLPQTDANRESIVTMREAAERARDLVRHLLAYGACQVLEFQEVDLRRAIRGAHACLSRRLVGAQDLVISVPDRILPMRADTAQLIEALENLVQNAADAMPDGGTVTIAVSFSIDPPPMAQGLGGEWARVDVRDTGAGMAPEALGRACEPFYTTKGRAYNEGLGLSTAHGIVRQHGGFLDLASEPSEGTTVTVWLPLTVDAPVSVTGATSPVPAIDVAAVSGRPSILLVEDDDSVREYLERTLGMLGFAVTSASSGEEAVSVIRAQEGRFDVVLTDVVMPRMSGWAVYEEASTVYPDLRFLFMSGYGDDIFDDERIEAGGALFIQKPFLRDTLVAKLNQLLGASFD